MIDGGDPEPEEGRWIIVSNSVSGTELNLSIYDDNYGCIIANGYLTINFDYDGEWIWEKDR